MAQCNRHSDRGAAYICGDCDVHWCDECVVKKKFGGDVFDLCPQCRDRAVPLGRSSGGEGGRVAGDISFFGGMFRALVFPLRRDGWLLIALGALLSLALGLASAIPIAGLFAAIFLGGYFSAYVMRIVSSSSNGNAEMPDWPEFTDMFGSIIAPFIRVVVAFFLCFGPAFAAAFVSNNEVLVLGALAGGVAYMPMALLGVSLDQSILGFAPIRGIGSILKVPLQYLVACLVLAAMVLFSAISQSTLQSMGVGGIVLASFVSLYCLAVEARILGLLYYCNRHTLSWYGE